METTNLISTPAITGNVGSCRTEMASAYSGRLSFWKEEQTTLATNSCDGSVREYKTVQFTGAAFTTLVVVMLVLWALYKKLFRY